MESLVKIAFIDDHNSGTEVSEAPIFKYTEGDRFVYVAGHTGRGAFCLNPFYTKEDGVHLSRWSCGPTVEWKDFVNGKYEEEGFKVEACTESPSLIEIMSAYVKWEGV